jgi:hypothetical protein
MNDPIELRRPDGVRVQVEISYEALQLFYRALLVLAALVEVIRPFVS